MLDTKAERVGDDALDRCRHHLAAMADELEMLLAGQVNYYRSHALE